MFAEKFKNLFALQLPGNENFAVVVDAMTLEDILCEINADGANLHVDAPLRRFVLQRTPFGTRDAVSGRRPHHHLRRSGAHGDHGRYRVARINPTSLQAMAQAPNAVSKR